MEHNAKVESVVVEVTWSAGKMPSRKERFEIEIPSHPRAGEKFRKVQVRKVLDDRFPDRWLGFTLEVEESEE